MTGRTKRRFGRSVVRLLAFAFLAMAPILRASDADAIAALRTRIEQHAAQLDALRAELARLEADILGRDRVADPPPVTPPPSTPAVKFGGLIQGWYAAGDAGFNDTFRIRRAELKVSGELTRKYGWVLMIDPAKSLALSSGTVNQSSRLLQDAFITVAVPYGAILQFGQYRVPLSREGLEPAAALDTVERALFLSDRGRGGNYGDIRDIGVSLRGTLAGRYDYQAGIFNGSGESQNDIDREDRKAVIGRFVARMPGGLSVGASGAWGGTDAGNARRDRFGGEVLYVRGPLKLAAELMTGSDGDLDRRGFYLHAGYRFRPRVEGIVRVDGWDPDTTRNIGLATANETDYTIGVNYSPFSTLRLQANAIHKVFSDDALGARNLVLVNLQTSW
jgi:hypothetical protein